MSALKYAEMSSRCKQFEDMKIINKNWIEEHNKANPGDKLDPEDVESAECWEAVEGYEKIKSPVDALDTYIKWFEKNKNEDDVERFDTYLGPLIHLFCMFVGSEGEFEFGGSHNLDFYIQGKA